MSITVTPWSAATPGPGDLDGVQAGSMASQVLELSGEVPPNPLNKQLKSQIKIKQAFHCQIARLPDCQIKITLLSIARKSTDHAFASMDKRKYLHVLCW